MPPVQAKRRSTGLDSQEQETVRWAEQQGHTVVAVVQDAASGAKVIASRRHLRPWLSEPEKLAQYDGIVVYRMDRLTRGDSAETRRIETWADEHGKTLMTADDLIFPCEGADGIRWDLAKRIAHDEWLRIRERYGRMQRTVRANGGFIGRPPWGFTLAGEFKSKVLTPIPEIAPLITEAFERTAAGEPLRSISSMLAEATGRPWHEVTLQRMLRNPVYEKVVGASLAMEAQTALARRGTLGRDAVTQPKALLAKLKCGNPECDATGDGPSPMYRIESHGTKVFFYRCSGLPPRRRGCGNMIRLDALDSLVLGAMDYWNAQTRVEHMFVPATENAAAVAALRARLAGVSSRAEMDALWQQIEALEAEGSTPAHWVERETGQSVGEWLWHAPPGEQRDYLAQQDIRAWHEGPRMFVTVNGAIAAKGGVSALATQWLDED